MLDILLRWNRWGSGTLVSGMQRDCLPEICRYIDTPEVIVLKGPRRAGKTTVLFQLMDFLEHQGISPKAMLHLNFEEPALSGQLNVSLLDQLYDTYRNNIYPSGKAYLFLDEIQNIPAWEKWVRARSETENIKIFLTGSSAHLMSRELGTLLTGRHFSFSIFPLSFKEHLRFMNVALPKTLLPVTAEPTIQHALNQYLQWGGFPEVVLAQDEVHKSRILKQYFDDILFKDVVVRHNIRDVVTLRNIAVYLLTQSASLVSFQRIAQQFQVSLDLAKSYCGYLQEAFLIEFLPFYSLKISECNRRPQKVHAMDLGLKNAIGFLHSPDHGHLMETAVYLGLKQQQYEEVFYWSGKQEIDFVLKQNNRVQYLIQATYDVAQNIQTQLREQEALKEGLNQFSDAKAYLISMQPINLKADAPFKSLPLWYFLLTGFADF